MVRSTLSCNLNTVAMGKSLLLLFSFFSTFSQITKVEGNNWWITTPGGKTPIVAYPVAPIPISFKHLWTK